MPHSLLVTKVVSSPLWRGVIFWNLQVYYRIWRWFKQICTWVKIRCPSSRDGGHQNEVVNQLRRCLHCSWGKIFAPRHSRGDHSCIFRQALSVLYTKDRRCIHLGNCKFFWPWVHLLRPCEIACLGGAVAASRYTFCAYYSSILKNLILWDASTLGSLGVFCVCLDA